MLLGMYRDSFPGKIVMQTCRTEICVITDPSSLCRILQQVHGPIALWRQIQQLSLHGQGIQSTPTIADTSWKAVLNS
jgi:hypothetical protein